MEDYRTKVRVIIIVILMALGVLSIRLGQLQLLEASAYSGETHSMAVREKRVTPARGAIFDRNGKLMVDNEFTYTVTITPRYFDETKIIYERENKLFLFSDSRIAFFICKLCPCKFDQL